MTRALIYTRISQDQSGEGAGVARQEEACRQLAASRGWTVVGVESDNSISAYTGKERPGFERALAAVQAGEADVLVAWAIDRLTRSIRDLLRMIDLGVQVTTANGEVDLTTATGRMVATIIAAVAAAEVEQKAARQVLANRQKALAGGRTKGVRPFGYEDDGVTVREGEAAAIREAARDVLDGATLSSVARAWRERGFRPAQRRGGEQTDWSVGGVKYVLRSPRYIGKRVYRGEIVGDAAWGPILDVDTFERLRRKLDDPARLVQPGRKRGGLRPENLLSSFATCGACGGRVRADSRGRKPRVPTYTCRAGKCFTVDRADADAMVAAEVIAWASQPGAASLLPGEADSEERARLVDELRELEAAKGALGPALGRREISLAIAAAAEQEYDARIAELGAELGAMERGSALSGLSTAESATAWWAGLTPARQRQVVESLMRVRFLPRPAGVRGFDESLVEIEPV